MISKIVWQTHEWDYEDLPEIYKKTSKTWQALNPGWQYNYLNAKQRREMIKDLAPSLLNKYDSYSTPVGDDGEVSGGILQCDLWRIVCIHAYGGVYADLDSICIGHLDEMLSLYSDKEIVISSNFMTEGEDFLLNNSMSGIPYNFKVNSGAGFAGKKNSTILKRMLDIAEDKIKENYGGGSFWENFSGVCMSSDISLISYDFRWSRHSSGFNHKNIK
jgi:hypothetical protein